MPDTITSHITFTPDTTASSVEVNQNFSNMRGTLLPIEENTTTASNNSHDIGSTDHRWDNAYCNEIFFSSHTTAGLQIRGNTAGTGIDLYLNGTLGAEFTSKGMPFKYEGPRGFTNTSASNGDFLYLNNCGVVTVTSGSSTINSWVGDLELVHSGPVNLLAVPDPNTTAPGFIDCLDTEAVIHLLRDGSTVGVMRLTDTSSEYVGPGSIIQFIDFPNTTGTVTYSFLISATTTGTTTARIQFRDLRMVAYQL